MFDLHLRIVGILLSTRGTLNFYKHTVVGCLQVADWLQTKGMTLEDISILFGDPVELSFEQALSKQEHKEESFEEPPEVQFEEAKGQSAEKVETISES